MDNTIKNNFSLLRKIAKDKKVEVSTIKISLTEKFLGSVVLIGLGACFIFIICK